MASPHGFEPVQRGPVIFTAVQPMQCGQRRYRRGRGCRPVSPSYCAPRLPPKGFPKFETSPSPDRIVRGYSGSRPIRCTTKRPSRQRSHKVPSSRHQAKATRSHCRSSDKRSNGSPRTHARPILFSVPSKLTRSLPTSSASTKNSAGRRFSACTGDWERLWA